MVCTKFVSSLNIWITLNDHFTLRLEVKEVNIHWLQFSILPFIFYTILIRKLDSFLNVMTKWPFYPSSSATRLNNRFTLHLLFWIAKLASFLKVTFAHWFLITMCFVMMVWFYLFSTIDITIYIGMCLNTSNFIMWRICKDKMDKSFGDCSIPQEKSNADITRSWSYLKQLVRKMLLIYNWIPVNQDKSS